MMDKNGKDRAHLDPATLKKDRPLLTELPVGSGDRATRRPRLRRSKLLWRIGSNLAIIEAINWIPPGDAPYPGLGH